MKTDIQIITALQDVDDQGKLKIVEQITGIPEERLREYMAGHKPLDVSDRIILNCHLEM